MPSQKADTWMPFYVGDYLRDTMHLRTIQHGAYVMLLLHYWTTGAALPDDDEHLASVTRLSEKEWLTHRQTLSGFFEVADGRWRHKRVEFELEKARRQKEARSEGGRKGANSKWHGKGMGEPLAEGMTQTKHTHTSSPSPSPSSSPEPIPEHTEAPRCRVFVKPTLAELTLHAAKIGLPAAEAEKFFHYYESNGWKVGRNPMKSWQAAMVNWRRNWEERRGPQVPEANQTQERLDIPRL
jgi:uncharacterized protein YdaU (DUF1376 family)